MRHCYKGEKQDTENHKALLTQQGPNKALLEFLKRKICVIGSHFCKKKQVYSLSIHMCMYAWACCMRYEGMYSTEKNMQEQTLEY